MVNLNSQFLFPLGGKIKDKEINDVRLVVGRVLDVDDRNREVYILKDSNGRMDWFSAKYAHDKFTNLI